MRTSQTATILICLSLGVFGCEHIMLASQLSAGGPEVVPIGASFEVNFANACQDGGRYEPDNCASGGPRSLEVDVDPPGVLEVEKLGDDRVTFRAISLGTVRVTGTALLDGESHSAEHSVQIKPIEAVNDVSISLSCGYMDVNGSAEMNMRFSADSHLFVPINSPDITKYFDTNGVVRIEPGSSDSSILVIGTGVEGVGVITSPDYGYEKEIDIFRLETMVLDVEALEDQEDVYRLNGSIGEKKLYCWAHEFTTESLTPDVCEFPGTWAPSQEIKVVRHSQSTCRVRIADDKHNIERTFEL